MDAPTFIVVIILGAALAVALDAMLVIGWRRRREGKSFWHPRLIGRLSRFRLLSTRAAGTYAEFRRELQALARDLGRNELNILRGAFLAASFWFSVSLGYANLHADMVEIWQPWAWLICFGLAAVVLAPRSRPHYSLNRSDLLVLVPVGIALIVRVVQLEAIPSGLHTDEVTTADFTMRYIFPPAGKTFYPLRSGPNSQPVLFYYLVRLSLAIFGHSIAALRVPSVLAGVLAILATYALIALWQDRRTALFAALLLSTYHYHLHWSRVALNNIWDTVWIPIILASLVWGWKKSWSGGALLAGIAIGFSQYFYVGSRVALFLVPYVLHRLWKQDRDWRRLLVHAIKMTAMALIVALPLVMFAIANPEVFLSRAQLNYTLGHTVAARDGTAWWACLKMSAEQAWLAFAGITVLPDQSGFYGPGIPFLFGLAAPFFLTGLIWSVYRRQYLPLLWIVVTFFFADFLIPGPPHTSHIIGAIPAMIWVTVFPLGDLARLRGPRLTWLILILLMLTDLVAYFAIIGAGGGEPAFSVPFPPNPNP